MDCRHFLRGRCLYGEGCRLRHDPTARSVLAEAEKASSAASAAFMDADKAFIEAERHVNSLRKAKAPREQLIEAIRVLDALKAARREMYATTGAKTRSRYATRKRLQNAEKCGIFRQFLVDTYGAERLRAGSGVLDVAGGRGGLGFELVNIVKAPTTVVDPRPLGPGIARLERKWAKLHDTRRGVDELRVHDKVADGGSGADDNAAASSSSAPPVQGSAGVAVDRLSSADSSTAAERCARRDRCTSTGNWHGKLPRMGNHGGPATRGVCWQPELYGAVCSAAEQHRHEPSGAELLGLEARLVELKLRASRMRWTRKGLERESCSSSRRRSRRRRRRRRRRRKGRASGSAVTLLPTTIVRVRPARLPTRWTPRRCGCLRDASAIVGMHPDGATEPIVDFAIAMGIPWAVVPCCVYSAEAPDRRNPRTGKRIVSMSTAAFIEYLVHKGGGPGKVGVATLPFAGKNVVVFSRPERSAECTQGASAANQHCLPCDSETSVA